MPGCITRCTTFRRTSIQAAWEDIRGHFGPRVPWSIEAGTIPYNDVAVWNAWASSKGIDLGDVNLFGKWLIWKLSYGTVEYGNLPTRKRDHVGISCIPCPYDTGSDDVRTRVWLGLEETDPLPTRTDHGIYYMKVAQQGNKWGFECTDPNCPYFVSNGRAYFYV